MNKVYLLTAINFDDGKEGNPFEVWYDCVYRMAVVARNEEDARNLCAKEAGLEGGVAWLNPNHVSCSVINPLKCAATVLVVDTRLA